LTSLPVTKTKTDLAKYGGESAFLKRIQLSSSKDKYAGQGLIAPGHFGVPLGEAEIQDLGATIDILPLCVRDKALDTNEDPPLAVFDPDDEVFQDIEQRAGQKDSGCMYGPSFLVFERNTGEFYEFFCGNKSARREAGKFGPYLPVSEAQAAEFEGVEAQPPQPLTLSSEYVKRGKYQWYVPVVNKCSAPFTNLPPIEKIVDEINKFLNPKVQEVEKAEEGGRER